MDFTVEHLPVAEIRRMKVDATQRLLGDTIQISDADWEADSRLAGWTRAHTAAHIARNADAYRNVIQGALTGRMLKMYASEEARFFDVERSSEQSPLELQIDLDTSASGLASVLDDVTDDQWDLPVRFAGTVYPLKFMVLSRLSEVVLHHVDLDCGFEIDDIEEDTAGWLLRWCIKRLHNSAPKRSFRIETPDGSAVTIGPREREMPTVTGPVNALVGWLSGRESHAPISLPDGISPQRII